jgi:hypothetical protein
MGMWACKGERRIGRRRQGDGQTASEGDFRDYESAPGVSIAQICFSLPTIGVDVPADRIQRWFLAVDKALAQVRKLLGVNA